jgi:hypothetical protein
MAPTGRVSGQHGFIIGDIYMFDIWPSGLATAWSEVTKMVNTTVKITYISNKEELFIIKPLLALGLKMKSEWPSKIPFERKAHPESDTSVL